MPKPQGAASEPANLVKGGAGDAVVHFNIDIPKIRIKRSEAVAYLPLASGLAVTILGSLPAWPPTGPPGQNKKKDKHGT